MKLWNLIPKNSIYFFDAHQTREIIKNFEKLSCQIFPGISLKHSTKFYPSQRKNNNNNKKLTKKNNNSNNNILSMPCDSSVGKFQLQQET